MSEPRTGTLQVPGATLHHEVRGSGPLLLLIPGGAGDSAAYDEIAARLADRFTVATYDPRGKSRSPLDGPVADQRVDVQSEDAARVLDLFAPDGEPAYVFGSSSSAIISLDLLTRHPDRVRLVIAHEPPVVEVLPDAARHRAMFDEVAAASRREGPAAAGALLAAGTGPGTGTVREERDAREEREAAEERDVRDEDGVEGAAGEVPLPPQDPEVTRRMMANFPFFLERELSQYTAYVPDLAALSAQRDRLVPAAGRESRGMLLHRPVSVLAEKCGVPLLEFPGGHGGYKQHPAESAALIAETVRARGTGAGGV